MGEFLSTEKQLRKYWKITQAKIKQSLDNLSS